MKDEKFNYMYSAPSETERKEIERIRNAYLTESGKNEKLERIKKLDDKVRRTPMIIAVTLGIIGALLFGLGMAMSLEWNLLAGGIAVAAGGIIPMSAAYPVYKSVQDGLKKKYGDEILRLSSELLAESSNADENTARENENGSDD